MYGFIYETTNNVNGMKYIGQKAYDKRGNWKTYLGSGVYLKNEKLDTLLNKWSSK